jgi:hypothetical protein
MTLSDDEFVAVMTKNIEHWRRIHAGVRTPTGKPKKVPWIVLVRCTRGHITTTSMKRPMGMRFRCNETGLRPGVGSILCERQVEIIEVPDMEKVCGISKADVDVLHLEWKENHT